MNITEFLSFAPRATLRRAMPWLVASAVIAGSLTLLVDPRSGDAADASADLSERLRPIGRVTLAEPTTTPAETLASPPTQSNTEAERPVTASSEDPAKTSPQSNGKRKSETSAIALKTKEPPPAAIKLTTPSPSASTASAPYRYRAPYPPAYPPLPYTYPRPYPTYPALPRAPAWAR